VLFDAVIANTGHFVSHPSTWMSHQHILTLGPPSGNHFTAFLAHLTLTASSLFNSASLNYR